jgi:hypothetical protein
MEQLPDASAELVPAGHSMQLSEMVESLNMPAGQALQKFEPEVYTS